MCIYVYVTQTSMRRKEKKVKREKKCNNFVWYFAARV